MSIIQKIEELRTNLEEGTVDGTVFDTSEVSRPDEEATVFQTYFASRWDD